MKIVILLTAWLISLFFSYCVGSYMGSCVAVMEMMQNQTPVSYQSKDWT